MRSSQQLRSRRVQKGSKVRGARAVAKGSSVSAAVQVSGSVAVRWPGRGWLVVGSVGVASRVVGEGSVLI